jgi:hypothetical protein
MSYKTEYRQSIQQKQNQVRIKQVDDASVCRPICERMFQFKITDMPLYICELQMSDF